MGRFGPRYGAPPAAPVCWALVGSLLRHSVALAFGRILFLLLCLALFLPLALVGTWVGRLRACLGSCLLLVVNSPSLVLDVFAWRFLLCGCPDSLCFSLTSFLGFFPLASSLADSSGWLRIVLGCPPSMGWRRCALPGVYCQVRVLSACPRGAAMPLGASVLWCSWSSRWGHLSQVGSVFFLSPRSSQSLSLLRVGWVPGLRAGSPASGWRCVLACVSTDGYLSYVFLQDVVTLWVNSVFLSLLITNEGLHCWLCFVQYSRPYWGRVVVFIRLLSVCRNFWWLVATLFPGLSLFFASGLSSPGLLDHLALWLRYADLLYLWLCAHSLLDQGFRGLFACPSPSRLLWFCKFQWVLFSPTIHTLRDGVTPAGSRLVCPRSKRRCSVFFLSLWAVSSCCPCPSG